MCKKHRIFPISIILIFLNMHLMIFSDVCAQTAVGLVPDPDIQHIPVESEPKEIKIVELVPDPDIQRISLGSDPKEVKITVRTDTENLAFTWTIDGPGSLSGDTPGSGTFYYVPPDYINEESAQAVITATAVADTGETVTGQITFTLLNAMPTGSIRIIVDVPDVSIYINGDLEGTAHPEGPEIFEAVPTGQAIVRARTEGYPEKSEIVQVRFNQISDIAFELDPQTKQISQLLTAGDALFEQGRFTGNDQETAFEKYKAVLRMAPDNRHAREKIHAMANTCKTAGDAAYGEKNHNQAKTVYQACLPVAQYALNVLGDSLAASDVREMQTRVKALEDTVLSVGNLLKHGDLCFEQGQFITPEEKNAFDLYKDVLKADPANHHAREKIYEMMKHDETWGNTAYKKKHYNEAKTFYQEYLLMGKYVMDVLGDRTIGPNIRKIQKRSELLETLIQSLERFLTKGDACFEQKQFVTPRGKNAFDLYKKALKVDPGHRHARQKIQEMANIYKGWGNAAYDQADYDHAEKFYQRYLIIAQYVQRVLGDRRIKKHIREIQKRLIGMEDIIIKKRLEPLEYRFSKDIERYEELRIMENQAVNVADEIMFVLRNLVGSLQEIELLYEQFPQDNMAILEKISRLKKTRRILEKEMSVRGDKAF